MMESRWTARARLWASLSLVERRRMWLSGEWPCLGCDRAACGGWAIEWAGLVWSERVDYSLCLACYEAMHAPIEEVASC